MKTLPETKLPNTRLKALLLCATLIGAPMPLALAGTTVPQAETSAKVAGFSQERAGFSLRFNTMTTPYKVMATYVMPGETLHLAALGKAGDYRFAAQAGKLVMRAPAEWAWQAPEKSGLYPVTIRRAGSEDAITLNVFVMVPYSRMQHGAINGYRIGAYPDTAPARHAKVYRKPRGFIEVTRENENTLIAPHFRLKQFLCKQAGGYPKYVVLQEKLLLKLELLLARVNEPEFRANTFTVMSGYRTPAYNRGLGNVKFSAHQYGMAADVYIDGSHSGAMDDLNADGHVDYDDAATLYSVADRLHVEPDAAPLVGGLGKYRATRAHGPFVHVDVRGYKARWARS
jgi:hypothetical protein